MIDEGVTTIGTSAFSGDGALRSVVLPSTLRSVAGDAFEKCANLATVYYRGSEEQWRRLNAAGVPDGVFGNARIVYDYHDE